MSFKESFDADVLVNNDLSWMYTLLFYRYDFVTVIRYIGLRNDGIMNNCIC